MITFKSYENVKVYLDSLLINERDSEIHLNNLGGNIFAKYKQLMKDFEDGGCDLPTLIGYLQLFQRYFTKRSNLVIEHLHIDEIQEAIKKYVPGVKK